MKLPGGSGEGSGRPESGRAGESTTSQPSGSVQTAKPDPSPDRTGTGEDRYVIERQDGLSFCEHPLCDQLHQRFIEGDQHVTTYVSWHVWDNETDDYAGHGAAKSFDTKREAKAWLDAYVAEGQSDA